MRTRTGFSELVVFHVLPGVLTGSGAYPVHCSGGSLAAVGGGWGGGGVAGGGGGGGESKVHQEHDADHLLPRASEVKNV